MDRSALSRATDSTSAPTPGYLYNDIAKTLNSPAVCADVLSYLLSRLSKNNPHVKKKSLKVLSKLVVHPGSRGMMKRTVVHAPRAIACIKDAISYRGSMDAINGDTFNVEVRECAKECLEIVYSDAGEVTQTTTMMGNGSTNAAFANTAVGGGGVGGYGSSSSSNGYGAPMGGGAAPPGMMSSSSQQQQRGMQGIGNPMFADPRINHQQSSNDGSSTTTVSGLLGMATQIGGAMVEMIKDPLAKNVPPLPGGGGYNPRPDPYASRPPGSNNLAHQTGGQWTMASNRGPNAYNNNNNNSGDVGGGGGTMMTTTTIPNSHPPTSTNNDNSHNNNESEYYKARNAQGTGQALSWAHAATAHGAGSIPSAPPSTTTPSTSSSSGGGVGGSWAMAAPAAPQSVASMARQPSVASAVPVTNGYVVGGGGGGGGYAPSGIAGATGGGGGGGEYERNLIHELCPPGGMKAEPPQDKLDEFAHAIPSLNPDIICPALLDALEEGNPWIMRAKALCVIETVLRVEAERVMAVGGGKTPYTDFFHACSAEIEPLAQHARANVKAPAKRVLLALGVDETSIMNGSSTVVNHNAATTTEAGQTFLAPPPNLLDFDEPITTSEETPASAIATAPALSPPTIDGGAGGNSLFSGLNTKTSHVRNVSAPVVTSTVPADIPLSSAQDDLLGGFGTEVSVPATSSFNDMFGSMTVKGNTTTETTNGSTASPANDTPVAQSGSSFGFINATPATPVPPSTTVPAAFDPLLSLGISAPPMSNVTVNNISANSTFTVPNPNIAQMQLAYQQNILMMQQMQMQQQQQVGSGALRGGMSGMPMMVVSPQPTNKSIMGANYMRQVPGVSGDNNMSSFTFLSQPAHKKENKSFDFVMDAMKSEKK